MYEGSPNPKGTSMSQASPYTPSNPTPNVGPVDEKARERIALTAAMKAQAEFLHIDDVCVIYDDSRSSIYRDPRRSEFMMKRGARTLIHVPTYLKVRGPQKQAA